MTVCTFGWLVYWFMVYIYIFTPFSTIFQLYCGGHFYWWRKPEYTDKTIDLSQVIDKHLNTLLWRKS